MVYIESQSHAVYVFARIFPRGYIESQSHAVYDIARIFPRGRAVAARCPRGKGPTARIFPREKVSHGSEPFPRVMHRVLE